GRGYLGGAGAGAHASSLSAALIDVTGWPYTQTPAFADIDRVVFGIGTHGWTERDPSALISGPQDGATLLRCD
ncbi:MAG TPA: hypothetical protein VK034_03535, partial [Enhygromyxa sp.]|nr:hypothetical protein [Enhygromyxa sp.]